VKSKPRIKLTTVAQAERSVIHAAKRLVNERIGYEDYDNLLPGGVVGALEKLERSVAKLVRIRRAQGAK